MRAQLPITNYQLPPASVPPRQDQNAPNPQKSHLPPQSPLPLKTPLATPPMASLTPRPHPATPFPPPKTQTRHPWRLY